MPKQSAGIVLYRQVDSRVEVLLGHPGGPFFGRKDNGVWSIPKGECAVDEDMREAARREFGEETGQQLPAGELMGLGETKLKSGKVIYAWAVEGEIDAEHITSNNFELEWPPKSGQLQSFPEIDRAAWFSLDQALIKIHPAQAVFIERLAEHLGQKLMPTEQIGLF